jgi:hypothetical protein
MGHFLGIFFGKIIFYGSDFLRDFLMGEIFGEPLGKKLRENI